MIWQSQTLSGSIYQSLKKDIKSGKYAPNESIPTEMELAEKFKVARGTVRQALKSLEEDDLIVKIRSRGTFVKEKPTKKQLKIAIVKFGNCAITVPQHYILPGIEKAAAEAGVELVHYDIEFILRLNDPEGLKNTFSKLGITGIICVASGFVKGDLLPKILKATGLPVVLPHVRYREDHLMTGFAVLRYEEKLAFTAALKHLIEKGHRKIATLGQLDIRGDLRGYSPDEYQALLKRFKLDSDEKLIQITGYDEQKIKEAVFTLTNMPEPPSAILCYSDFWAFIVYNALKEFSLKVPDDISVMGFCGHPERNLYTPPLSTVDLRYAEHGREAFKLLLESETWFSPEEDNLHPEIVIPFKLEPDESTKPVRIVPEKSVQ